MADSVLHYNPNYQVIICLVDKITPQIERELFFPHTIVEVEGIKIPDFESLTKKYNTFELSCVVKPYFAQYFFEHYPESDRLFYFDSDIYFFDTLESVERLLEQHEISISAHFTRDLVSTGQPNLRNFLNAGLYNTGFLAFKRGSETDKFLKWWAERLWEECYHNFAEGMFVDQLWLNFAPLFFNDLLIDDTLGHNVGYWNFHERQVSEKNGKYFINETHPLVFFHFSGYNPAFPKILSVHQNLYSFQNRPDVKPLFETYRQALIDSNHSQFEALPNAYYQPRFFFQKMKGVRRKLIGLLRHLLRVLES
jgi:hypothetical protein